MTVFIDLTCAHWQVSDTTEPGRDIKYIAHWLAIYVLPFHRPQSSELGNCSCCHCITTFQLSRDCGGWWKSTTETGVVCR